MMALERSLLGEREIISLCREHYGLRISSAERLALGTANCYRVSDGSGYYFLKEFQSGFGAEALMREAALTDFLAGAGIPTARFIRASDGHPYVRISGRFVCLEEYIDGISYGYDDFPSELMPEAAALLGRLHNTLVGYELPIDMAGEWLDGYSYASAERQYDSLLAALECHRGDAHYDRIKSDLRFKRALLSDCDELKEYYRRVSYKPTHGDYQGCQLICGDGHIRAVVDFSSARTLPAVWEIMRSYVQTSAYCRECAKIDAEGLYRYVGEYMKHSMLTKAELAAMPYVYLFQLARSRYGYLQYLTTDSEDRESLLRFAFWRTDICREVSRRAEELSEKLSHI